MKKLKIRVKLFLILLSLLLPLGFVLHQLNGKLTESIDFAIQQNKGVVYEEPLLKLMNEIADYQVAVLRKQKGDADAERDISEGQSTIDKLFLEVEAIDKEIGEALDFTDEGLKKHGNEGFSLANAEKKWQTVKLASIPTDEMFDAVQDHLARMIKHLGDSSGMILDPDLDTYYLVDAALAVFPDNLNRLANIKSSTFLDLSENGGLIPDAKKSDIALHAETIKTLLVTHANASLTTAINEDANFNGANQTLKQNVEPALKKYEEGAKLLQDAMTSLVAGEAMEAAKFLEIGDVMHDGTADLGQISLEELHKMIETRAEHLKQQRIKVLGIGAGAIILSLLIFFVISINITRSVRLLQTSIGEIAKGQDSEIPLQDSRDELGDIARSLVTVNDVGKSSLRVKSALDNTSTAMMMSDADLNIIYMNKSIQSLLQEGESEIKKSLPNFNARDLIGKKIDFFHKNPSHQQNVLERMGEEHKETIHLGNQIFDLTINRVRNAKNENIGFAVQWNDVTEEKNQQQAEAKIQEEVAELVEASSKGNFTKRLATDGRVGFFQKLCEGMNAINQSCYNGLTEINQVAQSLSEGDLTNKISGTYEGMFDEIKVSINNTIDRLKQITSEIKNSASQVSNSASEISASSGDLSRRTETQASTLEETAASMEQITGTVKANSQNARSANQFATEASTVAREGGEVVKKVVDAMGRITDSSTKISDIISVIDEIAFQTNLLALNAAVEAARAGDAGKGFAVVADEVRALAGRSSQASKQIKDLIQQSVSQVKDGSVLVDKAGTTLEKVVESFNRLAGLISEISNASEEQSTGINEINSAVSQMDATTQENAAMVQENTAAAQTLTELAGNLLKLINFFKSDDEDMGFSAPTTRKKMSGSENKKIGSAATKPATSGAKKTISKAVPQEMSDGWEEF
jgi:methyl-accepting chemotaxis protein